MPESMTGQNLICPNCSQEFFATPPVLEEPYETLMQKPTVPSVNDVEGFVKWMVKYGQDFALLRELYAGALDRFLEALWVDIRNEIMQRNLTSSDALMTRAGELSEYYTANLEKPVNASGGIMGCRADLRLVATVIQAKMMVMFRLAK